MTTSHHKFPDHLAHAALNAARIGALLVDADGAIRACNDAAMMMSGYAADALIGTPVEKLVGDSGPLAYGGADPVLITASGEQVRVLVAIEAAVVDGEPMRIVTLRDVTARRQVEDSLRELGQRMRLMIESARDAIVTIDRHSHIVDWNSAATAMFGWTRDEAIGSELTQLIVPTQHRASHHGGLKRFLNEGVHGILNTSVETTALNRDGTEFDIELSIWPVKTGGEYTFTSFIRNITDRKAAERAMALSETRYRAVVENANDGIIVTQDGFIRFANPRAYELTGRDADTVLATPFIEMIHADDRARVYGNYLRRMRGEAVENLYTFRVVSANRDIRTLQISAVAIDWEGRAATLNFLADVTEQIQLREKLTQSLAQREAILETSAAGIMFIQHGQMSWVNPALEQTMLGYPKGALISEPGEILFANHGEWRRFVDDAVAALKSQRVFDIERQLRRADGELGWFQITGRPLDVEDLPAGTIWNVIDIADRKLAEEEIRHALQRERELSDMKTRFVAMTSHEFRTPLAAILSSVELLEDYGDSMPDSERRDLLSLIKGSLSRLTAMQEQVLVIGRADSDKLEFRPEPLDVAAFCHDIVREVQPHAVARTIEIHMVPGLGAPLLDAKLMRHVLTNLLSNAIKYSPASGSVSLSVAKMPAGLAFTIADDGIGISDDDVPHLFETFYRGKNAAPIAGTGLGLAIVRQCVDQHGGHIDVESRLGHGTKVTVTIPLMSS
ncbi:MAG: PAS domain S-box protein [Burkholderiales bacterium]|nr:PAS domain S-box protein [Burkholderiales bacterium]